MKCNSTVAKKLHATVEYKLKAALDSSRIQRCNGHFSRQANWTKKITPLKRYIDRLMYRHVEFQSCNWAELQVSPVAF